MKKIFLLTIFVIILSMILMIMFLPSPKENSFKIKMYYYMNQKEFNRLKDECLNQDYESMTLRKNKFVYELDMNKEHSVISTNELKKKNKNIATFLEKFNVEYIQKEKNNIIINFNSQINFAQNIVYLNNEDDYEFRHIVNKKKKLKNKWYYTEEK